ncbi:MAG: serine/threonine-protein kinase [Acidobacteriota bacterium]
MDPERWRRIEHLFERAVDLGASQRGAFLDRETAGDPELRREVEEMLAAEDDGDSRIGSALRDVLGGMEDGEPIPGRLGPYRIVGEIGRGGLATVYLGERDDDEYCQRVAVKWLRRGLDTGDLLRRFRQERQILARLDHPHISRLLDGGSVGGRPYVVMEHIEGEPIGTYCRERRLGLGARLDLFLGVCDAVAYAHRSLVIHRDIKPGNILVTGDGQPKLLDFGIAKLIRPELHDDRDAAVTEPGLRLLTPEYASPEQVRGEALTTATDIYSLGILLYELLVGERPYELDGRDAASVERAVCGGSSEAPSVRLRRLGPAGGEVTPQQLRGDLDTIVLMALRKDPARRYPSVEQMADDLDRHLRDLPIRARRDAWTYRLGKFVRRHRAGVAGAALLAVTLTGASLVTARQARIAETERNIARTQRTVAETAVEFLVEIFQVADPGEAQGSKVTARELLDAAAARLGELEDQPEVQAKLADTIGRVYLNLGFYDRGAELLSQALEIRRRNLEGRHPDVASSLDHLGEARFHQNRVQEALELVAKALEIRRLQLGDEHPDTSESLDNLAAIRFALGDYRGAETLFRHNLELRERHLGPRHEDVAATLDNLAIVMQRLAAPEEAEALWRRALDLRVALLGEAHPDVAKTRVDLGALLYASGRLGAAEGLYRKALESQLAVLGDDHPEVAVTWINLAALLRARGNDGEAEDLLLRAIEVQRRHLDRDHVNRSYPLVHLAALLRRRGGVEDLDRAEALYQEALGIRRLKLPPLHPDLAPPLESLAQLELARLDLAGEKARSAAAAAARRAVAYAEDAAEIRRASLAKDHPRRRAAEDLLVRCRSAAAETKPGG